MVSTADVASSPHKLLKDLINKSLVVVWACSFIGVLHASLYHVLAEKILSFAEVLASSPPAPEMAGHAKFDSANSPSIVLDLSDKLVVHKPASWQVDDGQDEPETAHGTPRARLSQFLSARLSCPIFKEVEHQRGFLHRLDVPTSGLILVAKTHEAYYDLQLQVAAGQVAREYVVLSHGCLTGLRHITARLHWGHFGQDVPSVVRSYGKPSRTRVKAMSSLAASRSFSLLAVAIDTGRRHQIRVHMAHIGHAVVSDGKYTCLVTAVEDLRWCPSTFLHRYRLSFHGRKHPSSPDEVHEALQELPVALQEALTRLGAPVP